jgi:hypothetical protein
VFEIVKHISESREGLVTHTIGYGLDHNVDLLSKVSEWGSGTYSVVNTLEDVATVFGSVLGAMVSTTAQNVKVNLPPGFTLLSQMPNEVKDECTVVRVGDIQSEVSQILLLEVPGITSATIVINGYDLIRHLTSIFSIPIESVRDETEADRDSLTLAFLRLDVSKLVKDVRTVIDRGNITAEEKTAFNGRIDVLKAAVAAAPSSLQAILTVMNTDLDMVKGLITAPRLNRSDMNILHQHSGVYTTGRGMTSMTVQPNDATSPLVNRTTARYARLMRHASMQPDADPSNTV